MKQWVAQNLKGEPLGPRWLQDCVSYRHLFLMMLVLGKYRYLFIPKSLLVLGYQRFMPQQKPEKGSVSLLYSHSYCGKLFPKQEIHRTVPALRPIGIIGNIFSSPIESIKITHASWVWHSINLYGIHSVHPPNSVTVTIKIIYSILSRESL